MRHIIVKNKLLSKIIDYVMILGSLIFLFQAFSKIQIVNIYAFLKFLGIADNVLDIVLLIMFTALAAVIFGVVLTSLNERRIVKGVTKNAIVLKIIENFVFLFVVFMLTFVTYGIFFGFELSNSEFNKEFFLNIYLFYLLFISAIVKPEIVPEYGLTEKEKDGLI